MSRVIKLLVAILLATTFNSLAAPVKVARERPTAVECLAWVIYDEARGEPLKGARAVLDVVKTRMKQSGKSACQVVAEPRQFSGYKTGKSIKVTNSQLTNYWIVARMQPVVEGSTHFHATYVSPRWSRKMQRVKRVGKHIFYKSTKENYK